MKLPPLSLYVHLPWCVSKCPYCDFNSHRAGDDPPRERYVGAVLADLDREAQEGRASGRPIDTVFIGGGTPSLFTAGEIGRILDAADKRFGFEADVEITMEANPGTVERGDPAGYRAAGVNRLSLGAQSFDAGILQTLGRIHGPDEIGRAFDGAVEAGFDNINLDLMFALPGQDESKALSDVRNAIALGPQHISYYQLTLEPNTVFHARPPETLPDEDTSWRIQEQGQQALAEAGFEQYEISAYAKDGHQCRHNLNYWRFADYLAVGAGAHGKVTIGDDIHRYAKPAHPLGYIEAMEKSQCDDGFRALDEGERLFEFMLNALRLQDGFGEDEFEGRTGLDRSAVLPKLENARESGLILRTEGGLWRPSELGARFLNDLQAKFLG